MVNKLNVFGELRQAIKRTYVIGTALTSARRTMSRLTFDPGKYWEQRYRTNGNSGPGSYGRLAAFKAEVLNAFVRENGVQSVIEFGCGDGNQLSLSTYPHYTGLDIAPSAIDACQRRFRSDNSKKFTVYKPDSYKPTHIAEVALSLDVIFHLTDDRLFNIHMVHLFASATRFVIIYSDDVDSAATESIHVRHRKFSSWINEHRPNWKLAKHIPNKYSLSRGDKGDVSWSDFWIFQKVEQE